MSMLGPIQPTPLRIGYNAGMRFRPRYNLRTLFVAITAIAIWLAIGAGNLKGDDVLTFDVFFPIFQDGGIPNGYGGLNWGTMWHHNPVSLTENSGYRYGAVSGTGVAFNALGHIATVTTVSGGPFDFVSAYLTGAWSDGLNITVDGLIGGAPAYSQTVVVSATSPTFFEFNYVGVTELRFTSFGGTQHDGFPGFGTQFVMDNMVIAVPEPNSFALIGIAIIAIAVVIPPLRSRPLPPRASARAGR